MGARMGKHVVLIMDGASGWPIIERDNKTTLELANTPNMDYLAKESEVGLLRTIPHGMEPSSACACMSLFGYDPEVYYRGRAAIEAVSMGVSVGRDEAVFRCNLVTIDEGRMKSYAAGHISTDEGNKIISTLNTKLGDRHAQFYPGIGYRHLLKLKGFGEVIKAVCTPPHDIPDQEIQDYLPHGKGSNILNKFMQMSVEILRNHPVNIERQSRGELPANMIWLFWGSSTIPAMPSFKETYGKRSAVTSGVDLLNGLGSMAGMSILNIKGVTDSLDNDYSAQAEGAIQALGEHDVVYIHIEAPDEAAHNGSIEDKILAIERIDREVVARLREYNGYLRLLISPDHPTPIVKRTHVGEPVPFLLWGPGFEYNGARRLTEIDAKTTGLEIEKGYNITERLVRS
jgi:2,3-bisphosphoglycerate-independent phosphoglycerate mutase